MKLLIKSIKIENTLTILEVHQIFPNFNYNQKISIMISYLFKNQKDGKNNHQNLICKIEKLKKGNRINRLNNLNRYIQMERNNNKRIDKLNR
jgi:hypothetical protein